MEIKVEMIFENEVLKGKDFLKQKCYITLPFVIINGLEETKETLAIGASNATIRIFMRVRNYLMKYNKELLKEPIPFEIKIDIGEGVFDIIDFKSMNSTLADLKKSTYYSVQKIFKILSLGKVIRYDKKIDEDNYISLYWDVKDIRNIPNEIGNILEIIKAN